MNNFMLRVKTSPKRRKGDASTRTQSGTKVFSYSVLSDLSTLVNFVPGKSVPR
jgi:hypothetical protein